MEGGDAYLDAAQTEAKRAMLEAAELQRKLERTQVRIAVQDCGSLGAGLEKEGLALPS